MIQFKRGSTVNWLLNTEKLADGQPAYDKTRRKLRIGDGTKTFNELKDVSGLFREEILESNITAMANLTSDPIFTYGSVEPNDLTKGEIYFQKYNGAVEADYVIESGRNANYYFRKWSTGFIECWGTGKSDLITDLKNEHFKSVIYEVKTESYFEIKGFWN